MGFEDEVMCQWFAGSKLSVGSFQPDTLITIEEEAGGKKK